MEPHASNISPSQNAEDTLIFDEEELPVYYSENAIYGFSFFFGPLFGSVMMAMNLSRTKSKKGLFQVILFGVVLTGAILWLVTTAEKTSGINLFGNIAGASVLRYFFWRHYLGSKGNYKKRSIVTPLLIGLALSVLLIAAMFIPQS